MVSLTPKLALAILAFCAATQAVPVVNKRANHPVTLPLQKQVKTGLTTSDIVNSDRARVTQLSKAATPGSVPATNVALSTRFRLKSDLQPSRSLLTPAPDSSGLE
jgi:hypothetical protein